MILIHLKCTSLRSVQISDFQTSARSIALRRDTLFMAEKNRLLITNLHGVQRLSVSFTEAEGIPMLLELNGNFLAITTNNGIIKLMDVSRKVIERETSGNCYNHSNTTKQS